MAREKKVDTRLEKYRAKRDTAQSGEPYGGAIKKNKQDRQFVIQKHDASHLHFDLRLEIDGVLVSWAVPKGPSLNPVEKRLAIQTEDHPIEYGSFEGIIPAGQYGGGTVMIWDTGTYTNIKEKDGKLVPMDQCLRNGRIEIFLHGTKLEGRFALVKSPTLGKNEWLLIKMKDNYASARKNPVKTLNKSAVSGKTMLAIKRAA